MFSIQRAPVDFKVSCLRGWATWESWTGSDQAQSREKPCQDQRVLEPPNHVIKLKGVPCLGHPTVYVGNVPRLAKRCPGFSCLHLFIFPIYLLSSLSWNVFLLPLFLHSLFSTAVLLKGCSTDIHIQTTCQSMAYFLPLLKIHTEVKSKHLKLSRPFHIAVTSMQVFTVFLKVMEGTSLVAQWLSLPCNVRDVSLIPGWRTKIPQASKQLSLWTTTRAHIPQPLNPHSLEPTSHK